MSDAAAATTASQLTALLKAEAGRLGFALVGACPAVAPVGVAHLAEWLARGHAGQMAYLEARQAAYQHPRHVLDGVRSVLMLGLPYHTVQPRSPQPGQGRISRYAWGVGDYHDVIHDKLKQLVNVLSNAAPDSSARGVVDTAPLLEREFAQLAGLGWIGKHTLLINKPSGSYFFLAALLTDQPLVYDESFNAEHCGTCRACLDACPTQAFPEPYVLDATRCISYLTIELREAIPPDLRPGIGDWLFGCDVCQDVCPWNRQPPQSDEFSFRPHADSNPTALAALFELDETAFRRRFRDTPLWRPRRRGILRNAAIVLGNQRANAALPALVCGLGDAEPLIRGACAWALGQIGGQESITALGARKKAEHDSTVQQEIEAALACASCGGPSDQAASSQSAPR